MTVSLPIRVGVLGASNIAPHAIIAPVRGNEEFKVVAVAARDHARAAAFASKHAIPFVAASYDELIARDDIDLIYNGLPPREHLGLSILALCSGKAVVCEKSYTRNAEEARKLTAAAQACGRPAIESMHNRYHAVLKRAHEITGSGALGEIDTVEAVFESPIAYSVEGLRWSRELGGGALMDLGTYCVHTVRTNLGAEPKVISAQAVMQHGVDASLEAEWSFPSGARAKIRCSMIPDRFTGTFKVVGTRGRLEIRNFIAPQLGCRFKVTVDGETREESTAGEGTYEAQLRHVGDVLLRGATPLTGGVDAVAQMEAIDATYAMAGIDRRF